MEMRFVGAEEEAGPSSDITALVLRHRHGYWRAGVLLCVCGMVVFTAGAHTHTHTHTHTHHRLDLVIVVCFSLSVPIGLRCVWWAVPLLPGGGAG